MRKIHRILAQAAMALLEDVFERGVVLDWAFAQACASHPQWGKRDRAFLGETVFEIVRWRRVLSFLADRCDIPSLCAVQWWRMGYDLPDWLGLSENWVLEVKDREAKLVDQPRAVRESIPDWLDQVGESELGASWGEELHALNQRAPVFLRVNPLRGTMEEVCHWLLSHGVECDPVPGVEEALRLPAGKMLPKTLLAEGRVEIQDAGSQCVVPLLDPRPGESILDACAGAGGKSLQIAAALRNRGKLVAADVAAGKLDELKRRAQRAGVKCLQTRLLERNHLPQEFRAAFDRVLIDSPCSGLGTLRRQPDLKWRLSSSALSRVRSQQREILCRYADAAKPGGHVVYATCSILPSENRHVVESFCKRGGYRLLDERFLSPARDGFDGFYAALMQRVG